MTHRTKPQSPARKTPKPKLENPKTPPLFAAPDSQRVIL